MACQPSQESARTAPAPRQPKRPQESSASQPHAATQSLNTTSPEADDWTDDPWPALSDAEQLQALHAVRAEAQRRADAAGLARDIAPLETARFIMHTDVPRPEAARLILTLEKACDVLERVLPTTLPRETMGTERNAS